MFKNTRKELESRIRDLAAAGGIDGDRLAALLSRQAEKFREPIVVHFLDVDPPRQLGAVTVADGLAASVPMATFAQFKELEARMRRRGASLPAHRMWEVEGAVASGKRVSVFHFHRKPYGIWGFTFIW